MNVSWYKIFRSLYRKEPISSFIVIFGAVDAVIGGVDEQWSLLTFGLGTVGVAIALRIWQIQRSQDDLPPPTPTRYLPAHSSRPILTPSKRNTSR